MSAATITKRKASGEAAAFAIPAAVSTTVAAAAEPMATEPACGDPDAAIIMACNEYVATRHTYNSTHTDDDLDDCPLWARYEAARDAISNLVPQTFAGMVAKAKVAMVEARKTDGSLDRESQMALSWGWDLMRDLIRLQGSLPEGPLDAGLLTDHRLYDDLERQWIGSFDQGLEEKEAEALQARLRGMQGPILERMAKHRAASVDGLRARLRTLMLECQDKDFVGDAERLGLGLDERLTAMLVRDLAGVLSVPLDDGPQQAAMTAARLGPPSITILVEWMAAAWAAQDCFSQQALEAKKARDMRAAALHGSASDRETGRAMALERLILASPVTSLSDAIGQIMVVLTSVTSVANELDGEHHHTLYSLVETGVVALATVSRQHGIDLARIGNDILTGRALDRINEEVG
jgi:hypothetical protein